MARAYFVSGQCLVRVFAKQIDANTFKELGLTDGRGKVTINFNYHHYDIPYDDWGGPEGQPPDTLWELADATITMDLVHFDSDVLEKCLATSAGGGNPDGTMVGAGTLMDSHYIILRLNQPKPEKIWQFNNCYLANVIWPLGAERSLVRCTWRAIPFGQLQVGKELLSQEDGNDRWWQIRDLE